MYAMSARVPFRTRKADFMENTENLVRIDGAERQIVVGIAAIIEVKSAQHISDAAAKPQSARYSALVVMAGIDQHRACGPAARAKSSAMPQSAMSV